MEASERIDGSHAAPSSCGRLIAYIAPEIAKIRVAETHSPRHCVELSFGVPAKHVTGLKWSEDGSWLAVCSHSAVEVLDVEGAGRRVRLDNGSGGLGCFRSVDLLSDQLLTTWEFGHAKWWHLKTGRCGELPHVKTVTATPAWQVRPSPAKEVPPVLAILSRQSGEDTLSLQCLGNQTASVSTTKVPGDTRTMSWSPDGRWLALNGTPYTSPCLHIYTAGGHHYKALDGHDRAFERGTRRRPEDQSSLVGIKEVAWSPSGQVLALSRHNGSVALLNTRTFGSRASIEHFTTIDQSNLASEDQAPIFEESVAASGERSYIRAAHPFSPPRSELNDEQHVINQGVVELSFSCDGSYLATRDARMQSTVWVWNIATLSAQAVLIQHGNVRKLHWHPVHPAVLMIDCGESIAYIYNVSIPDAPQPHPVSLSGVKSLSWVPLRRGAKSAILASSRSTFRILYPEGRDENVEAVVPRRAPDVGAAFEEGASEDSLMDMLSGRKPLPSRSDDSYTRRVDMEVDEEDECATSARLDDTFRQKRRAPVGPIEIDPLDDSQIF